MHTIALMEIQVFCKFEYENPFLPNTIQIKGCDVHSIPIKITFLSDFFGD